MQYLYEKNDFAEVSKNLDNADLKIILLDHQKLYRKLKYDEQCCKKFWHYIIA